MTRSILVLSDTHVGSEWAILPPNFKLGSGNEIKLNPLQEELWDNWQLMLEKVGEYDSVILLGDLCNGLNKKEYGRHLVIPNLNEQVKAVIKLLKPICKNKEVVGISSSGYHSSADYEIDKRITQHFKGQFGGAVANYRIKGTNKVINISHGSGIPATYIGTNMTKQILQAIMSEALKKIPDVNIILRAHVHEYAHLEVLGKHFIYNPCWEGPRINTYSAQNYFRFQPTIGCVTLEITEEDINVVPILFKLNHERKHLNAL